MTRADRFLSRRALLSGAGALGALTAAGRHFEGHLSPASEAPPPFGLEILEA